MSHIGSVVIITIIIIILISLLSKYHNDKIEQAITSEGDERCLQIECINDPQVSNLRP
jgi:hypothetical protein